jgi:hypothetical protein
MKKTTMFNAITPNVMANLVSDIALAANGGTSGSTSISVWLTSFTGSSLNPNGGQYPAWTFPDGSGGIYPSAGACGSSGSPLHIFTGLTTNKSYYFVVGYDKNAGTFNFYSSPYSSTPTQAEIAAVCADGNLIAVIATADSGTTVLAGGGSQSHGGGGGHALY